MNKIAVINSANKGLGLALTHELLGEGYKVWALVRDRSFELTGTKAHIVDGADVTSLPSLENALAEVKDSKIDLLLSVAGINYRNSLNDLTVNSYAQIEEQFKVNALGSLQFCATFLPKMTQGGKIILLSSRMGSIADNGSGGRYGYRASKAALNAFGKSLAVDLKPRGISVGILHPGFVKTDMTDFQGDLTPEQSAKMMMQRINELNLENTGRFLHANGEELPW